jgi:hypothetical protein
VTVPQLEFADWCRPVGALLFCLPCFQGFAPLAIVYRPVGADGVVWKPFKRSEPSTNDAAV